MIYEFPDEAVAIRQGDIFVGLPRVEVSLASLSFVDSTGFYEAEWKELATQTETVKAVLPIRPVAAIVMSQDCDTTHGQDITLCEIQNLREVEGKARETQKPKKWVSILTQQARLNLKWFYLPPDSRIGFEDKMAADFTVTLRVPRVELEQFRSQRKGRLNNVADEHFRERISEFFRRYPYDEWYPLDDEELAEYRKNYPDAEPLPWQSIASE